MLIDLAVAEGKIPQGPWGLCDDLAPWCEDLREGGWIRYDDAEALRVRGHPGFPLSRNDIKLSRNFVVTAAGATWVKSSATAVSAERVAGDLAGLIAQFRQRIDETDAPEETKEEARSVLSRVGETAMSDAAAELLVRVGFAVARGLH